MTNPLPLTEFQSFPKIPRLFRRVLVSEKIDGTNACVVVPEDPVAPVLAQSRTRFITPESDNFGFAAWVRDHAEELRVLGPGRHFGEWWGLGINRGYGLTERRFSLFNVSKWNYELWKLHEEERLEREQVAYRRKHKLAPDAAVVMETKLFSLPPTCCQVVPVLCVLDEFDTDAIMDEAYALETHGSMAAPGFKNPEGIVVFHEASGHLFKFTFGNDGNKGMQ